MASRSSSALRKSPAKAAAKSAAKKNAAKKAAKKSVAKAANPKGATQVSSNKALSNKTASKLGKLPEWNLTDLYPSIDAPEVARDLDKLDADCLAFETAYKGKIAENVANPEGGNWLAEAVRSYEAIDDLAG